MSGQSVLSINLNPSIESIEFSSTSNTGSSESDGKFAELVNSQLSQQNSKSEKTPVDTSGKDLPVTEKLVAKNDTDVEEAAVDSVSALADSEEVEAEQLTAEREIVEETLSPKTDGVAQSKDTATDIEELLAWLPKSQSTSTEVNQVSGNTDKDLLSEPAITGEETQSGNSRQNSFFDLINQSSPSTHNDAAFGTESDGESPKISGVAEAVNAAVNNTSVTDSKSETKTTDLFELIRGSQQTQSTATYNQAVEDVSASQPKIDTAITSVKIETQVIVDESFVPDETVAAELDDVAIIPNDENSVAQFAAKSSQTENPALVETKEHEQDLSWNQNAAISTSDENTADASTETVAVNAETQVQVTTDNDVKSTKVNLASSDADIDSKTAVEESNVQSTIQRANEVTQERTLRSDGSPVAHQGVQHKSAAVDQAPANKNESDNHISSEMAMAENELGSDSNQEQSHDANGRSPRENQNQQTSSANTFGLGNAANADAQSKSHVAHHQSSIAHLEASQQAAQQKVAAGSINSEALSIHRKDFVSQLNNKVMLMVNQRLQQFEIRLDPPELGSMQIKVSMQNDQAVVNFVVQHQQAREAVEQNIQRLRDMMAEQGLNIADANVKEQSKNQSDEQANGERRSGEVNDLLLEDDTEQIVTKLIDSSAKGVDYYV